MSDLTTTNTSGFSKVHQHYQLSSRSRCLQWFIPQKPEIIWLSNMKNTWFMFCSSSPFLFLVETPSVPQISVAAESESAPLHQPGHQWVTRPGHSNLPHPSKGCCYISKHFCTHFTAAYMQSNIFLVYSLKVSFQLLAIYSFLLPMLACSRIKFSLCGVVYFWEEKSAGYYWLPWFLAIFLKFLRSFLKTEIGNYE